MQTIVGDPLQVGNIRFKHFFQTKVLQDLHQWDFRLNFELWKLQMNLLIPFLVFNNSVLKVKAIQRTL